MIVLNLSSIFPVFNRFYNTVKLLFRTSPPYDTEKTTFFLENPKESVCW